MEQHRCVLVAACTLWATVLMPLYACLPEQVLFSWAELGGIAKLSCNQISISHTGEWLLPFWMELGGAAPCQTVPKLHGVAGVLISPDQVRGRADPYTLKP